MINRCQANRLFESKLIDTIRPNDSNIRYHSNGFVEVTANGYSMALQSFTRSNRSISFNLVVTVCFISPILHLSVLLESLRPSLFLHQLYMLTYLMYAKKNCMTNAVDIDASCTVNEDTSNTVNIKTIQM